MTNIDKLNQVNVADLDAVAEAIAAVETEMNTKGLHDYTNIIDLAIGENVYTAAPDCDRAMDLANAIDKLADKVDEHLANGLAHTNFVAATDTESDYPTLRDCYAGYYQNIGDTAYEAGIPGRVYEAAEARYAEMVEAKYPGQLFSSSA